MDTQTMKDLREELGLTEDGGQNVDDTADKSESSPTGNDSGSGNDAPESQPDNTDNKDAGTADNTGTPAGTPASDTAPGGDGNVESPAGKEDEPGVGTPDSDTQPPQMILGKFKTQDDLVTAYQNLEKKLSERGQVQKEVETVSSDEFDAAVKQKIAEENWKLVSKAFKTITDPEQAKEATYLLEQFRNTGDGNYLRKARDFLDRRVDNRLEAECMNVTGSIRQQAYAHKQEILLKPVADALDEMYEEDPSFFEEEDNQNLMTMAIKLNPAHVDVRSVKKAISEYQKKQYDKGYAAGLKEAAKKVEKTAPSLKSKNVLPPEPVKKPVGRMTTEEMLRAEMADFL